MTDTILYTEDEIMIKLDTALYSWISGSNEGNSYESRHHIRGYKVTTVIHTVKEKP